MHIETKYVCEICGEKYKDKAMAETCEAKGPYTSLIDYWPIGMIVPCSDDVVLAVAERRPLKSFYNPYLSTDKEPVSYIGHLFTLSYWAFRTNGRGNSLEDELCGGDLKSDKPTDYYKTKLNLDTINGQNMIEYLKAKKITPTFWNGKEPEAI